MHIICPWIPRSSALKSCFAKVFSDQHLIVQMNDSRLFQQEILCQCGEPFQMPDDQILVSIFLTKQK